jgi:hypothetical protein
MAQGPQPKTPKSFLKVLMAYDPSLKKMRPKEIRVFNVNANYGSYQIKVGPEHSPLTCRQLKTRSHSRPIEIHGELHHLFIEDGSTVSAMPSHDAIDNNLKGTVIIKGLVVHLRDEQGAGSEINDVPNTVHAVEARERINLAGETGDKAVTRLEQTGKLAKETYRIIQSDISNVIKSLHRSSKSHS